MEIQRRQAQPARVIVLYSDPPVFTIRSQPVGAATRRCHGHLTLRVSSVGGMPSWRHLYSALTQDLAEHPLYVLTVGGVIEAEPQRKQGVVRKQLGHLMTDLRGVSSPANRPSE